MAYDDAGSIIGGLLSGFSSYYFPMAERKDRDKLARERMEIDRQQAAELMAIRKDEADYRNFERAMKLQELAREQAWEEQFLGGGGVQPSQTMPQSPQGLPGGGNVLAGMGLGKFPVTSPFGPRTPPMPGASANHRGVDVAAPPWTPVTAPFGGKLVYGQDPKAGNWAGVEGDDGRLAKVLHLSDFGPNITRGQAQPGDVIGYTGSSGLSTGPHAHVAVMTGGQHVDPTQFSTPAGRQYAQAGSRTLSDATGDPLRNFTNLDPVSAEMFILGAPKGRRETLRALWKAANPESKEKEGSFSIVEGGDGKKYRVNAKTGEAFPVAGVPGKKDDSGGLPIPNTERFQAIQMYQALKSDPEVINGTNPQKVEMFELTRQFLEKPKIQTLPDGSVVSVPGFALDGGGNAQAAQSPSAPALPSGGAQILPPRNLAQQTMDKKAGEEFAEFMSGGGFADVQKNLDQLRRAEKALAEAAQGKGKNLSGWLIGKTPDAILKLTNPEAVDIREQIEEVVQRNLRLVLGAQFTEREGERLIARAFNPSLDEKTNLMRVSRLLRSIEQAAQAKMDAYEYLQKNGTLAGFQGKVLGLRDIEGAMGEGDSDGGGVSDALKQKYGLE